MHRKFSTCLGLLALTTAGFYSLSSVGSGEKKSGKEMADKIMPPPVSINFNTELNLPFASLESLDDRIRSARNLPDPVALACAAQELAVAEKVAGKKAALTAEMLNQEAADLAKLRFDAQELEAVAMLTGVKELNMVAKKAAKYVADRKAARDRGEKTRGITHDLFVDNHRNERLHIRVNGNFVGYVDRQGDNSFHVGDHAGANTQIYWRGMSSGQTGLRNVSVWKSDYHWRVN